MYKTDCVCTSLVKPILKGYEENISLEICCLKCNVPINNILNSTFCNFVRCKYPDNGRHF